MSNIRINRQNSVEPAVLRISLSNLHKCDEPISTQALTLHLTRNFNIIPLQIPQSLHGGIIIDCYFDLDLSVLTNVFAISVTWKWQSYKIAKSIMI